MQFSNAAYGFAQYQLHNICTANFGQFNFHLCKSTSETKCSSRIVINEDSLIYNFNFIRKYQNDAVQQRCIRLHSVPTSQHLYCQLWSVNFHFYKSTSETKMFHRHIICVTNARTVEKTGHNGQKNARFCSFRLWHFINHLLTYLLTCTEILWSGCALCSISINYIMVMNFFGYYVAYEGGAKIGEEIDVMVSN